MCVQVYTRKDLLSKSTYVAWSTGTYQGNGKRFLKGHELLAQVHPDFLILLIVSSVSPGLYLAHVAHLGQALSRRIGEMPHMYASIE